MRIWGGRFGDEPDARMADFTRSIEIDAELALDDIAGSIAHVRGLGRAGLLTDDEVAALEGGLAALRARRRGRAPSPGTRRSRTSTSTSRRCSPARVGRGRRQAPHRPVAQRPGRHGPAAVDAPRDRPPRRGDRRPRAGARRTSRSATATPSCPGSTHIQPAQPVLFAHHLLAYVEMLERDRGRLADARAPAQRLAAGRRRARRRRLPAGPRDDGRGARLRRRHARTRSTPSRTATSWSRCSPRRRSRWSTSAAWPRRSPGGRTRGSGSCASPTRSRPARR